MINIKFHDIKKLFTSSALVSSKYTPGLFLLTSLTVIFALQLRQENLVFQKLLMGLSFCVLIVLAFIFYLSVQGPLNSIFENLPLDFEEKMKEKKNDFIQIQESVESLLSEIANATEFSLILNKGKLLPKKEDNNIDLLFKSLERVRLHLLKIAEEDSMKTKLTTVYLNQSKTISGNNDVGILQYELKDKEEKLKKKIEEIKVNRGELSRLRNISDNTTILKDLIDLVPYPIFIKDAFCQYLIVNEAQAKLFSVAKNEIIGKDDSYLVKEPKELSIIQKTDKRVLINKTRVELPAQEITHIDGTKIVLITHKIPFVSDIDGSVNILGISIDITSKSVLEKLVSEIDLGIKIPSVF